MARSTAAASARKYFSDEMIARISILAVIVILLPFIYADRRMARRRPGRFHMKRAAMWLPCIAMLAYTAVLACLRGFAPADIRVLYVYLLILGAVFIPAAIFTLFSIAGKLFAKRSAAWHGRMRTAGAFLAVAAAAVVAYGSFFGNKGVNVRSVEYACDRLPASFDGYRIALFSDAHVGSYVWGSAKRLQAVVDTINNLRPDMIAFAGDLQNMQPDELLPVMPMLSGLEAPDGVFSVLGNHDDGHYLNAGAAATMRSERVMCDRQRQMGWRLLTDGSATIRKNGDSIFIAGMYCDGKLAGQRRTNPHKAMAGIPHEAFTVMLQHDPTSWRHTILPQTTAQLTLSGHTHGGQMRIAGMSPAAMAYDEYDGMYYAKDGRALFVTTGINALVPFRFGMKPEVVVITLRNKKRGK